MNNKFYKGQVVKVVNSGCTYSTYATFFKEENIDIDLAARYEYGHSGLLNGEEVEILASGLHVSGHTNIYVVAKANRSAFCYPVYLIGQDGLGLIHDYEVVYDFGFGDMPSAGYISEVINLVNGKDGWNILTFIADLTNMIDKIGDGEDDDVFFAIDVNEGCMDFEHIVTRDIKELKDYKTKNNWDETRYYRLYTRDEDCGLEQIRIK